jgi:integrase
MSIQVECPKCHAWWNLKRGGSESCSRCGKIPKSDRLYRLRQRIRISDDKVVHQAKNLGRIPRERAEMMGMEAKLAARRGITATKAIGPKYSLTWKELASTYLRKLEVEGKSFKYQRDSELYLTRMGKFWGFGRPVSELNRDRIQEFRAALLDGRLVTNQARIPGKSAVDRHHAAGKAAWEYGAAGLPNPFKQLRLFRPHDGVVRYLSNEQKRQLLQAARKVSPDLFAIIAVALSTGLRKNNILQLRRDQVDFERGLLTVIQKMDRPFTVFVGPRLLEVLRGVPDNGTPWFWVGHGGTPYHIDWRRPWEKAKLLAGIPREFRFHDLRHDFGTSILRATGNIKVAKELLGHSDMRMTERYAHVMNEQMRAAVEAIDPLKDP